MRGPSSASICRSCACSYGHGAYLGPDFTADYLHRSALELLRAHGDTAEAAERGAARPFRYHIAPDGNLFGKTLVVEQGSDGMTLDDEGHLYLTGEGVIVFDSHGRQIDHIEIPDGKWTANVAFGGRDRQTLFITASTPVSMASGCASGAPTRRSDDHGGTRR